MWWDRACGHWLEALLLLLPQLSYGHPLSCPLAHPYCAAVLAAAALAAAALAAAAIAAAARAAAARAAARASVMASVVSSLLRYQGKSAKCCCKRLAQYHAAMW